MRILDWFIPIIMIIGMYLMGNKNKWCFPVMATMNIIVIINCFHVGLYGIMMTNSIYLLFGVRNFIKWHRGENR